MRTIIDLNDGWIFEGNAPVRLPHNAVDLPFSYFDEGSYQRAFRYERILARDPAWEGREVILRFDGAMADTRVAVNGVEALRHPDGYTPFALRLTDLLRPGDNRISVTVDGSENPDIPPFGGVIDYLTYAGIYREAWLELRAPVSIGSVRIETPDVLCARKRVVAAVTLDDPQGLAGAPARIAAVLRDATGAELARTEMPVTGRAAQVVLDGLAGIRLWSPEDPALYTLELDLVTGAGSDTLSTRFGFREVSFTAEGFFLNGARRKIVGLNRHQSFPYAGYAMGRAAQERDAEILRHDLRLDMVRCSHYPQSTHFLNRCDEIGLLVFEEIPGWQHIGGARWQDETVENVRRMIRRDWNHPSIVIWGVRINESQDHHDLYTRTNAAARATDPTRPIGGVRYITESELLEDVYTMNDFILGQEEWGGNRPRTPLRPQAEVTGRPHPVPYLVTEFNGHMFPTKSWDQEQRQAEHALRHLQVLDAAFGDPQIAGAIGWCAFDYNTHKDFGSGDRICHHGVMDMFREPKFAAYAYASQGTPEGGVVFEPVTFWARGERNIGGVLPLMILTNCDEVEFRYGNHPPKRVGPDRANFPNLPHPPVIIDQRHITPEELGLWGMSWEGGTLTGYLDGRPVVTRRFVPDPVPTTLVLAPDRLRIGPHDDVRIMVRALDQAGNRLPWFFDPVSISVSGAGERIGPGFVPLRAGTTGFWLRATGAGAIRVTVTNDRLGSQAVTIIAGEGGTP
ncbi:MAG: glycoside hydrolase family 2 protein [Rubellimicrobium sp.]|nr:glycoside hydrolase family 2 protein [Rubellimicrobium sp.]